MACERVEICDLNTNWFLGLDPLTRSGLMSGLMQVVRDTDTGECSVVQNTSSPCDDGGGTTYLPTEDYRFLVSPGTYSVADLLSQAVTNGYTGGKTNVLKVHIIANPGGFTPGNGELRAIGSGNTSLDEGSSNADGTIRTPVTEFNTVVVGDKVEVTLTLF